MGPEEPHALQQGEVQSLANGEEQLQPPVGAAGCPAGKQLVKKGLGGSGGQQVDHEPATDICESLWTSGNTFLL